MWKLIVILLIYLSGTICLAQEQFTTEYPLNLKSINVEMPKTTDGELAKILYDKYTVFYKLPQVYQHYNVSSILIEEGYTSGDIKSIYGIYYTSTNKELNANLDFPWETTIGLNHAKKAGIKIYNTINFIYIPEHTAVLIFEEVPIKWIFPENTVVGEMILIDDVEKSKRLCIEIRTRTKNKDSWNPKIYRPLGNKNELERIVGKYEAGAKYLSLRNSEEDEVAKFEGVVEYVPNLNPDDVRYILGLPLKNVSDEVWSAKSIVPTSKIDFNIFPKDYSLALVGNVGPTDCANCHRQTQISVRNLIPNEPLIISNPSLVGNIRGCDGIFSWYPFEKSSISKSMLEKQPSIKYRPYDIRHKMIELYNPNKSYPEHTFTTYVKDSLKPYELPRIQKLFRKIEDEKLQNIVER